MPADRRAVVVLAAVIERDGRFLVTRRREGTHLSGYWEFPGGKCERDETHEQCLARELLEELNVGADIGPEIMTTEHAYADRTVRLHFRSCRLHGAPVPMLGQDMKWVARQDLESLPFPDADRALLEKLRAAPTPRRP